MRHHLLPAALLCALCLWPHPAGAVHQAPGGTLANDALPSLEGGKQGYLGKAGASVFIFFQPGQEHSHATLVELAKCQKELSGKPIHWSAIVSDRYPRTEVEAVVQSTGITMPVLIDHGDELYGKLGVIMHPMVGVADEAHVLKAFLPFTKVNYCEVVRAHILHTLKELSDEGLDRVLNPPPSIQGGEGQVARRHLKLGEMLLKAGNLDKALESAKRSLEHDGSLAAAHSLLGATLAAKGDCPGATKEFDEALKLDPKDPRGLEGKKGCAKK
ncbi:MAG: tetratricopeptide repeat protein [Myxococcaceae bacterium]